MIIVPQSRSRVAQRSIVSGKMGFFLVTSLQWKRPENETADVRSWKSMVYIFVMLVLMISRKSVPHAKCPNEKTTSLNLSRNSGLGVGNLDTELLRACNNLNSLSR